MSLRAVKEEILAGTTFIVATNGKTT